MSESMLQKDFKSKDVRRMRNIISKNYTDKVSTQTGYTKSYTQHEEGEVWEEEGKQWTIKNGLKQTVTRFDKLKKSIMLPLLCPECNRLLSNTPLNKKMWPIHGSCFDCVIVMETKLKLEGKFEEYQKNMMMSGVETHIKEIEGLLLDIMLDSGREEFVTEAGDIEDWGSGTFNKDQIVKDMQEYLQKLKSIVKD
jgi:hypothetical protein